MFGFTGPGEDALADAASAKSIPNYREYSTAFASSGQPNAVHLELLKERGYERVIYLAFSDQDSALAAEDRIVKELGMEYVHIPVTWDAPVEGDFAAFVALMEQAPDKKTLLHCQYNLRASAFSLLYRVIYQGVAIEDAKEDMNSVWAPNDVWRQFIFDILERNGISADCEVCDWST